MATVYSLFSEPSFALLGTHGYTFRMWPHHHIHPLLSTREGEVKYLEAGTHVSGDMWRPSSGSNSAASRSSTPYPFEVPPLADRWRASKRKRGYSTNNTTARITATMARTMPRMSTIFSPVGHGVFCRRCRRLFLLCPRSTTGRPIRRVRSLGPNIHLPRMAPSYAGSYTPGPGLCRTLNTGFREDLF